MDIREENRKVHNEAIKETHTKNLLYQVSG